MRLPGDTVEVLADSGWAWRTISDDRSYNVKTNRPPHPDLRPVSTGTPMSPEASSRHSRQGSGSLTRTGTAWFIAHDMRRLNRLHWVMGQAAPRVQPPMQVLKCPPPDDGVIVVVEQFGPVRGNGKPSGRIFPFSVGCTIRWNPLIPTWPTSSGSVRTSARSLTSLVLSTRQFDQGWPTMHGHQTSTRRS